jgi:hypothetical protein
MEFHRAEIGRVEETLKPVVFADGETISSLLSKANIVLSNDEKVRTIGGELVELNEVAETDETYFIVKNYKNGFY